MRLLGMLVLMLAVIEAGCPSFPLLSFAWAEPAGTSYSVDAPKTNSPWLFVNLLMHGVQLRNSLPKFSPTLSDLDYESELRDSPELFSAAVRVELEPGLWLTHEPSPGTERDERSRPRNIVVRIYRENKLVQKGAMTIKGRSSFEPDVLVEDYNFDGRLDFSCSDDASFPGEEVRYRHVFLFNPERARFEHSERLSTLSNLCIIESDRLLLTYWFSYGGSGKTKYRIRGWDTLEPVWQETQEVDPKSQGVTVVITTEYRDGKIILRKEARKLFEEF